MGNNDGLPPVVILIDTVFQVDALGRQIFIYMQHLAAVDLRFQIIRQGFPCVIHIREQRVPADTGDLHRIEHGPPIGLGRVAFVVMEKHLAVRQRTDRHTVLPDIGDQHDVIRVLTFRALVCLAQTPAKRTELFAKHTLGFRRKFLSPEQQDQVVRPGLHQIVPGAGIHRLRQIQPPHFCAKGIMQFIKTEPDHPLFIEPRESHGQ